MVASTVGAASAVADSGVAATASGGLYPALIGFMGTVVGAAVAQGAALIIARRSRIDAARRDAVSRAFDTAGSQMATVAFNKYVQFCEEYTSEYYEVLTELFRSGPHKEAANHAWKLGQVHKKWVLWITRDVNALLEKVEALMLRTGADAGLIDPQMADAVPNRGEVVRRMYQNFAEFMGLPSMDNEEITKELAVDSIMDEMRKRLGIEQFGRLRQATLDRAGDSPGSEAGASDARGDNKKLSRS